MDNIISVTIDRAGEISGLGRTTIYKLIKEGHLKPKKVGRRTLILVEDLQSFIDSCPEMSQ